MMRCFTRRNGATSSNAHLRLKERFIEGANSGIKKLFLDVIIMVPTDFQQTGAMAAQMILAGQREHIEVPFYLVKRKSL